MGMTGFLNVAGDGWQPCHIGDFTELAPFLAPTVAPVSAEEQVAVLGASQQHVWIRRVGSDRPDRRIWLDGEGRVGPGGTAIRRAEKQRRGTWSAIADAHEQVLVATRLSGQDAGIVDTKLLSRNGLRPGLAIIGRR